MGAICKKSVVKQEMEARSFSSSVSVTAPLAATAVIKSVTTHPRRHVGMSERVQSRTQPGFQS